MVAMSTYYWFNFETCHISSHGYIYRYIISTNFISLLVSCFTSNCDGRKNKQKLQYENESNVHKSFYQEKHTKIQQFSNYL